MVTLFDMPLNEFLVKFFGITLEEFLDPNKVKVLDGIAGSAKSSTIDKIFKAICECYARHTSTNKLKRDAEERFGGFVDTIAGGLFKTIEGEFFKDMKDPVYKNIVIDEILQTDSRVLKWIDENKGKCNIIVCTDTRQMLAPEKGGVFLERFREFCHREDVIYIELTKTYRPVNKETEELYKFCYEHVEDDYPLYYRLKKNFRTIFFSQMEYTHTDTYICHTNDIEEYLYKEHHIGDDYEANLIPKGNIARKGAKDPRKYPIICQKQAKNNKCLAYLQPANIGTVTRYQGSEVLPGNTLYYLVEPFSKVENREFYTMISRAKDAHDIVIVITNVPRLEPLTSFGGKPVKRVGFAELTGKEQLANGETVAQRIERCGLDGLTKADMRALNKTLPHTDKIHYTDKMYIYGDDRLKAHREEQEKTTAATMQSLLRREPHYSYSYMDDFLRAFEKMQQRRFRGADVCIDVVKGPTNCDDKMTFPEAYEYGLDLYSAYPHILKNEKMPSGEAFFPKPDDFEDDPFHTRVEENPNMVDFYVSWGSTKFSLGDICTGSLVRWIQQDRNRRDCGAFYYLGSAPVAPDNKIGEFLVAEATKTVESKKRTKQIHYGFCEKPYMEGVERDENFNATAYILNEVQNHQLLMCAIRSELMLIMLKIKTEIYGNAFYGNTLVDCEYFDTFEPIEEIGKRIKNTIPGYRFRIFENTEEKPILYKNYEDLMTAKERKTFLEKQRRKNKKQG